MMENQNIEEIPEEDIYFDKTESDEKTVVKTGTRPYADNCPLPIEWSTYTNQIAGSCSLGEKRNDSGSISAYEIIQEDSACFLTNLMPRELRENYIFGWESISPFSHACYQYQCDHQN